MKALVLAGGAGTRLRPFTHTSAKQLMPIANRPVLFYGLDAIRAAGITEAGIVVGDTAAEIRAAVGDGSRFGLAVTYLPQEAPLGLAHAVRVARGYLGGDDFLMYLGDNYFGDGIGAVADRFRRERPDAELLLAKVPDPRAYGVAELDPDGAVRRLAEKPRRPRSDLAVTGVYAFTPDVHEQVDRLRPSRRGELEITDAIQGLIDSGRRVTATQTGGDWKDIGSAAGLLEANRAVLDRLAADPARDHRIDGAAGVSGPVVAEPGAWLEGSSVVGPAVIGAGAEIIGSVIGPHTSIGAGCRVEHSEIEDSVLLPGATVRGAGPVRGSLLGHASEVAATAPARRCQRLVLGDHSKVLIDP
ncbi:glucose-1-phosphate thymidylyltransferase [Actinomadura viridis]|uniref:glucose-1-phosphate thymidylyltransferase n=1 Tax=Actinomadura viridis TaxID=58110 RepID=UPI0036959EBF